MTTARHTESVWDYPRPPAVVADARLVVVAAGELELARSDRSFRVLETSHPPVFYLPPENVNMELLATDRHRTFCEFKGVATYLNVIDPEIHHAGWTYPEPSPGFESIRGWVAFYPSRVGCWVDGERVESQEGTFYGGWITADVTGPFKGGRGTAGW